jgi:2'-5' RNA ligase
MVQMQPINITIATTDDSTLQEDDDDEHGRRGSRFKSCWLKIRHNPKTSVMAIVTMSISILLFLLAGAFDGPVVRLRHAGPSSTAQQFPHIMHTESRCQKASIFPFRVGCPASCADWRSDVPVDSSEIFYRTNIAWYFGQPAAYVPAASKTQKQKQTQTAYDKGINFQCPLALAENFIDASADLAHRVQSRIPDTTARPNTRLRVNYQTRMHLSLAYLCCLRANETDWVREIMNQWVMDTQPFDFYVTFDQVQCWHERSNSVTEIILVDAASQRKLTKLNHDLARRLESAGIPVSVPHEMQMPFHMTLQGFHRIGAEASCTMSARDLRIMYEETERLSLRIGSNWTGTTGGAMRMRIHHEPRFGATARVQTGG